MDSTCCYCRFRGSPCVRHGGKRSASHCWDKFRKKVIDNEFKLLDGSIIDKNWNEKAKESQERILKRFGA